MQLGASPEDGANSAVPLSIHYLTLLPVQAHALSAGRELGKRHRTYVMLGKHGDVQAACSACPLPTCDRCERALQLPGRPQAGVHARTRTSSLSMPSHPFALRRRSCVLPRHGMVQASGMGTQVSRVQKKKEDLSTVTNDQNAIDPSLHGVCCIKY